MGCLSLGTVALNKHHVMLKKTNYPHDENGAFMSKNARLSPNETHTSALTFGVSPNYP